jgi:hypothetical protein
MSRGHPTVDVVGLRSPAPIARHGHPVSERRQEPDGTVRLVVRDPGRRRFFHSLPLPSRTEGAVIAAVLLIAALSVGGAAWYASNRTAPVFEPPPSAPRSTPGDAVEARAPVLAFYGDWYVSGTSQGGIGPAGWPAIVSQRIGAEGTAPHAVTDAGYVATSATAADTFVTLAVNNPEPRADVTIVFGSRNDYEVGAAEITAAATRTFDAIRAAAPQTQLLVIGPAWTDPAVPPELPPVRDAVQRAAEVAGATFIDPLADRWFFDEPSLISTDAISPSDTGHAYLADRIEPVVRQLLTDAPGIELPGEATSTP